MRAALLVTVVFWLFVGWQAKQAFGGNQPHPTLDLIASETAGKPVTVWCETNVVEWDRAVWQISQGQQIGAQILGFTFLDRPTVYVGPRQCETLLIGLQGGYRDAGVAFVASAVLTLLHEAVHQRGITDEGMTDCAALPLVVPTMERHFGLSPLLPHTETRQVWQTVRRKIAGKWRNVRVRTARAFPTTIPNPDHSRASQWALAWHRSKPANYQGGC